LCDWNVHRRKGIAPDTGIACVAHDTNDLAGRLGKRRPPRPDLNAIPQRVAFGPILPGHRLVDDDHSRRGVRVLFVSKVRVDFLCPTLVFLRAMHEAT
jgi:hypothetical protein